MDSTAAPSSSTTRRSPTGENTQAGPNQSGYQQQEQPVQSTYTNLVPKQIIGSGSFGKCSLSFQVIFIRKTQCAYGRHIFLIGQSGSFTGNQFD